MMARNCIRCDTPQLSRFHQRCTWNMKLFYVFDIFGPFFPPLANALFCNIINFHFIYPSKAFRVCTLWFGIALFETEWGFFFEWRKNSMDLGWIGFWRPLCCARECMAQLIMDKYLWKRELSGVDIKIYHVTIFWMWKIPIDYFQKVWYICLLCSNFNNTETFSVQALF